MTGTNELQVGTVVEYHGSILGEHGQFVVTELQSHGRLRLANRDYPQYTLKNVGRTSVTPTGETLALCETCGHSYERTVPEDRSRCWVLRCDCAKHVRPVDTGDVITARPFSGGRAAKDPIRGYVVGKLWEDGPDGPGVWFVVWFPALGDPDHNGGERAVRRDEMLTVRSLDDVPDSWVMQTYRVMRRHPKYQAGQGIAPLPLEARVRELRAARRERDRARRAAA